MLCVLRLLQEAGMLRYVSRDANVTQFYGACVTNGDMMLVEELMEVGDGQACSCCLLLVLLYRRRHWCLEGLKGLHEPLFIY